MQIILCLKVVSLSLCVLTENFQTVDQRHKRNQTFHFHLAHDLVGTQAAAYIYHSIPLHQPSPRVISRRISTTEASLSPGSYPLEMHIVCQNTKYEELSEALQHPDGLAVMGIMFEVRQLRTCRLTEVTARHCWHCSRHTTQGRYPHISESASSSSSPACDHRVTLSFTG